MKILLEVLAGSDVTPDSATALDAAHSAAAQRATAWTEPQHVDTRTLDNGTQLLRYMIDATPRPGIVTTANIAPALLPART